MAPRAPTNPLSARGGRWWAWHAHTRTTHARKTEQQSSLSGKLSTVTVMTLATLSVTFMVTDLLAVNFDVIVNGTVSGAVAIAICSGSCFCWKHGCLDLVSISIFDFLLICRLFVIDDRWFKFTWFSINGYRLSSFDLDFDSVAQTKATVLAALYFGFGFFWFWF